MKHELKILVIGCGSIGERHIRNLQALNLAEITVCDLNSERLNYIKDTYHVSSITDYEKALGGADYNAVLVCSPTSEHIAPALAAVRANCHVFIEKPLSHTLDGVDDLINEARDRGLVIMTGFNYRFHPGLRQVKRMLENNKIGRPFGARAHFGSYFLYRLPFHNMKDYRQDYAANKTGGGVILDAATHLIDFLRWFFGEVEEIYCCAGKTGNLDLEVEDYAEMILRFRGGITASVHADFVQQPAQNKLEIIGEGGTLAWSHTTGKLLLSAAVPGQWQEQWREVKVANKTADMYLEEMKHLVKCLLGRATPITDGIAGKRVLEIVLAAKDSAATGKTIRL